MNTHEQELLITCARDGKLRGITTALQRGADVNYIRESSSAFSALAAASSENHHKIVKFLVKHGAEVDAVNIERKSALILASEKGHLKSIKVLLKHGAHVDLQDRFGRSALITATKKGDAHVVKVLLKSGAQVNLQDSEGKSALMLAVNERVLQLLLEHGAQVNLRDNAGKSALMLATQTGNERIVELLLEQGGQVNVQDNAGKSPLMLATQLQKGNEMIFELFQGAENLDYEKIVEILQAQVNSKVDAGKLALVLDRNERMVKLLLEHGAQVNLQDNAGRSALMLVKQEEKYIIDMLLEHGAQMNLQDNAGKSALMHATSSKMVKVLLQVGVQIDLQDNDGKTALMHASKKGAMPIVRMLIEHGVQVNLQDNTGKSALMYAKFSITNMLLQVGAKIDLQDNDGKTALMIASDTKCVDLLLTHGAKVDLQDKQGNSALMTACQNGNADTAAVLLDADADTYLRNFQGKTAIEIAMTRKNFEVIRSFAKLRTKKLYPGILFSEGVKKETITTTEKDISLEEVGISLSIPKDAVSSTDPPVEIQIQPCFSGSWELPMGVELVSPAYIVKPNREVEFKKDVLVKIWHHANLESEEDCEDMMFLTARSTPEYRGTRLVYVFREMNGVKGSFTPRQEQPVGEIGLKHFCIVGIGEKRRRDDNSDAEIEEPEAKCLLKGKASLSNYTCYNCAIDAS